MHLNISATLVRELADYAARTRRPSQTGLVLTADGWDTAVWTTPHAPGPVAITAEDVDAYMDGDDLDDDCAEALTRPDPSEGSSFEILHEDGIARTPGDGQEPQVVVGVLDGPVLPGEHGISEIEEGWTDAFWFDLNAARELIAEDRAYARGDAPRGYSLYITEGGRYVMQVRSRWEGEASYSWVAITAQQAAEWVYGADEDRVADEDTLPMVLAAALHARRVLDAITVPSIDGYSDPDARSGAAWRSRDAAAEAVTAAGIMATFVREDLAKDLRRKRGQATRVVVTAFGGNQTRAAEHLGISQPSVYGLINGMPG
jgi:hypothetical protein